MNECPNCSGKLQASQEEERVPEQAPVVTPPPQLGQPAARPGGASAKTWLMSLLFAALFIVLGLGLYWGVRYWKNRPAAAPATLAFENPPAAGQSAKPNALQRFIQVTGVRLTQNAKKATEARFLVVNQSPADVADLSGTVTLRARGADPGSSVGTFSFKSISLGPYEAKEVIAPVETRLRVYELPDWQNLAPELTITSP
jgi:hypothetical protein